jgi:hypothetical protein
MSPVFFVGFENNSLSNNPYIMKLDYARCYTNWVPERLSFMGLALLAAFLLRG